MIGQAAGEYFGKKLEKNETLEQKQKEKEDALKKLEEERTNLTKEQNAELTAAMNAGPEAMKQFVDKYDKFFGGGAMDDVAERLDILIAKEDALIRKQEENKKAISDLTLE